MRLGSVVAERACAGEFTVVHTSCCFSCVSVVVSDDSKIVQVCASRRAQCLERSPFHHSSAINASLYRLCRFETCVFGDILSSSHLSPSTVDAHRVSELSQLHVSWRDALKCISVSCEASELPSFPFNELQSIGSRHEFSISKLRHDARVGERFPANFESTVCLHYDNFPSVLRLETAVFLARVTSLKFETRSDVDLDFRWLPSLRDLSIDCRRIEVLQTLQCNPLDRLRLGTGSRFTEMQRPISAEFVSLTIKGFDDDHDPDRFTVARLFPWTNRLIFLGVLIHRGHHCVWSI